MAMEETAAPFGQEPMHLTLARSTTASYSSSKTVSLTFLAHYS